MLANGTYQPVQIIGICQDTRSDNGKRAGLTFGFKNIWAYGSIDAAGSNIGGSTYMNPTATNSGGWSSSSMKAYLRNAFFTSLDVSLQSAETGIVPVRKAHQAPGGMQTTTGETVFLPSAFEVCGTTNASYNPNESASNSFQHQWFAKGGRVAALKPNAYARKQWKSDAYSWYWLRSTYSNSQWFDCIGGYNGSVNADSATYTFGLAPCFAL